MRRFLWFLERRLLRLPPCFFNGNGDGNPFTTSTFKGLVVLAAEELKPLDGETDCADTDEDDEVFDSVELPEAAGDTNVEVDTLGDPNDVLGDPNDVLGDASDG